MATSTAEALRHDEAVRAAEPPSASDLDGTSGESNALPSDAEARCVVCMAQHLLAASNAGANAAREAARRLELECPACLARPGGGH